MTSDCVQVNCKYVPHDGYEQTTAQSRKHKTDIVALLAFLAFVAIRYGQRTKSGTAHKGEKKADKQL